MALVETTIDGRTVEVERDRWALDVAREMGIGIPTLCFHPALEPYGACRLCVVEVTRGKWTWLTTSCDLPIREGLSIRTGTPEVLKARRMALELLWAQAPKAEPIIALAKEMGLEKPRFAPRARENDCILCGLCVRACRSINGRAAISFAHRGVRRRVGSPFNEQSELCIGCGACVTICPTGAVKQRIADAAMALETWHTEVPLAECADCGSGFAAAPLVEKVAAEAGELAEAVRLCPRCRAKAAGARWIEAARLAASTEKEH